MTDLIVRIKNLFQDSPPKFKNQPAIVFFHLTLLMLDSFDQREMTFTADMFLVMSWRDHRKVSVYKNVYDNISVNSCAN